jgi:hypothetical protein
MAKKNQNTKSKKCIKCQCSVCDQIAFVRVRKSGGLPIRITKKLPAALSTLKNPSKMGSLKEYVEPMVIAPKEEMVEPSQDPSSLLGQVQASD